MNKELNIKPVKDWGFNFRRPLTIAGPCSAETEEQVHETAKRLSKYPVDVLRAGIWKPRTRPNSFEGVGSVGLKWLKDAGFDNNLPVAVEVANVKHVYEALRAGIDILWIGARTTVNPFAVQEICDALQGVDIPVLVKNPINPDMELWIGAFERLNRAGITKMAAIHRGFSTHEKTKYRNIPRWNIPIELKRRYPDLNVICDPSHICGNRELLREVAQTALDIGFDGIHLESHINPDKALSDAKQQVTPEVFGEIIESLVVRENIDQHLEMEDQLDNLRAQIDSMDKYLLELLSQRMDIVREIGYYKLANNLAIVQPSRWNEIIETRRDMCDRKNLTDKFVAELFHAIHKESIHHQTNVMKQAEQDMEKASSDGEKK
ncbi:MAG: bifunctional 3-deoxy-7-phosphoheptulonate synthase/chorismate mutase type II [Chitinophagales bacterium]|nr:bifunctional 3-deoxy-7-phosphoheptulonate synthase/chorismate mutase type II [Chitinophagales bacterium]HAE13785.1 3-deoxy-7-phosphoheptulonate synthase [Bacteroidota bacterium]MCB9019754.1 bifunctional 3-deoxy-7-phosphoheptulonate synthase/chorismate mutase type II [Chitinophagales bacterium]MCB9022737.1 bifunctional 3-deoxy-7-phosphoheptulonate synthase/chorismate mutase type II [Chitinophagales bacterium]HPE98482.1 chorismate mutase [Chitinophagales bacterium]